MSETKLLRCPFCGGGKLKIESKTKYVSYRSVRKYTMSVRCNSCHARGKTISGEVGDYSFGTPKGENLTTVKELEEKAITAWNTRKPMQNIVERLKQKKTDAFERLFDGGSRGIGFCEAIEIVKEEGEIDGGNL